MHWRFPLRVLLMIYACERVGEFLMRVFIILLLVYMCQIGENGTKNRECRKTILYRKVNIKNLGASRKDLYRNTTEQQLQKSAYMSLQVHQLRAMQSSEKT